MNFRNQARVCLIKNCKKAENYTCGILISIFSKDESNFMCKGYKTIIIRHLDGFQYHYQQHLDPIQLVERQCDFLPVAHW